MVCDITIQVGSHAVDVRHKSFDGTGHTGFFQNFASGCLLGPLPPFQMPAWYGPVAPSGLVAALDHQHFITPEYDGANPHNRPLLRHFTAPRSHPPLVKRHGLG